MRKSAEDWSPGRKHDGAASVGDLAVREIGGRVVQFRRAALAGDVGAQHVSPGLESEEAVVSLVVSGSIADRAQLAMVVGIHPFEGVDLDEGHRLALFIGHLAGDDRTGLHGES